MHSSVVQIEFQLGKEHKIMTTNPTTIAHGTLEENGDTWFLVRPDRMILLDVPFVVDDSLRSIKL
jgi:hypothetical protein